MCVNCNQETKFVNLHAHSMYSILDGMSKPEDIIAKVKRLGQPAVALTEHGNVFSAIKMYKLAKKEGIKFIYGVEFYICHDRKIKDKNNKYFHLTVLAKNEVGRININKLVSLGYLEGYYYKPRIDFELLEQYKEGLIVLSGCMASEVQQTLAGGKIGDSEEVVISQENINKAKDVVTRFRSVFGGDYYLEVQSHRDKRQQALNRAIADLAKHYNIPLVATADSHYVEAEDMELHGIFIQIGQNREVGETYSDTQLQSEGEARSFLHPGLTVDEIEQAIVNTRIIADKCDVKIPLSAPLIPHVDVPKEFDHSENDYMKELCRKGWIMRGINKMPKDVQQVYLQRFQYEYNAITQMGFSGYYLLVYSYANTVKRRGIARGSGGGSLVAYLLNIVDIDPITYGLYFERFIDVGALELLKQGIITPEELKVPDFDLDFGCTDREKVIKFIVDTYGEKRVASLGTFQTIWAKSALKDVGRVLGIPFDVTNALTKELGKLKEIDFDEDTDYTAEDDLAEFEQIMKDNPIVKKYVAQYPKLFKYAKQLTGIPRSFGKHPCGRVVTIEEILHYTAIAETKGEHVLHIDMKDAEALGLVKIDTLGLRTVDIIYDTLEMIKREYEYIAPHNLNFDDLKVLELFANAYTDGIFQFESDGMKSTLKKMFRLDKYSPAQILARLKGQGVTVLDLLGVVNALYRPGSMQYIDNYIRRMHGEEEIVYLHPELEPFLKVTYGIIVFQEQLIEIGRYAGMRNPDELRVATGKKKKEVMEKVEPELRKGLYERGWTQEQVDKLWADMLEFAKYSFNKAHSYAYALIAFMCGMLKVHHPLEFICAMTNSYENSPDKNTEFAKCFHEAKRLGVDYMAADYKNTTALCTVKDGKIVYGTSLIKFCNRKIASELDMLATKNHQNFISLCIDVLENTIIDTRQMGIMLSLGYFSQFGKNKRLLDLYELFQKRYKASHKDATKVKRISELLTAETETQDESLTATEQIFAECEFYGFARTTYPGAKKSYVMVLNVDTKYTPKVTMYQFATGNEMLVKCKKAVMFDRTGVQLFDVGDVISITKHSFRERMRKVGDDWVGTGEQDMYIDNFVIVKTKRQED